MVVYGAQAVQREAALCVLQVDVKPLEHRACRLLPEDEAFVVLDDGLQLIALRQAQILLGF
jgi:hypothetical protein